MRIALLCHYFHPEPSAPSARLLSLARDFKAMGHEVVVITGFPNHPTGVIPAAYRDRWMAEEDLDGVCVLRNWVYATPNEGMIKKTLGHLSFMASAVLLGGPRLGTVDVLVVSSPTFFTVLSAWVLSVFKGVPFVFEVRDLWPAVFVDLGVIRNRALIGALEALEMFLYRRSAAIVTVTESFRRILICRGVPAGKVTTITNGVDLAEFSPGPGGALRSALKLDGHFVVLYIGTHGISHALETVLASADLLADRENIRFLFVGGGARKKALEEQARKAGLSNVLFLPEQPREKVLEFYRMADVCLVPLRNVPLFDTFIPSKMFEIMGVGKPIVASVRGEAAEILEASGGALVVAPEAFSDVADAIGRLEREPALRARLGERGRSFAERHYQRKDLARRYAELLAPLAGGS